MNRLFKFDLSYIQVLDGIASVGNAVLMFIQTLFVAFGLPVVLLCVLVAEFLAVKTGLGFDPGQSTIGAFALVMLNVLLEFQSVHIENKRNHSAEVYAFSLRSLASGAWSAAGLGQLVVGKVKIGVPYKKIKVSPAQRFRNLQTVVTLIIIGLSIFGRLEVLLAKVILGADSAAIPFMDGIKALEFQSTLLDLGHILGAALFTFGSVRGAQVVSNYIAIKVNEALADMRKRKIELKKAATRERNKAVKVARPLDQPINLNHVPPRPLTVKGIKTVTQLTPHKVIIGGAVKYECPGCGKQMTKQGWHGSSVSAGHKATCGAYMAMIDRLAQPMLDHSLTLEPDQLAPTSPASSSLVQ